jgi:hypothetical protein
MMVWKADPGRLSKLPGAGENEADRRARYEQIAEAAVSVAFDPATPPIYGGKYARSHTLAALLGIALHESGYRRDVDLGPCKPGECDGGKSACIMQIQVGSGKTSEGWTKADLFGDRDKCFRAGLRLLRRSFITCSKVGPEFLFDGYAGGSCGGIGVHKTGLELLASVGMLYGHARPPIPDAAFLPRSEPKKAPEAFPTTETLPRTASNP